MAEKVKTKRSGTKKTVKKTVQEPFAETAEPVPVKKASRKKPQAAVKSRSMPLAAKAKPIEKAAGKKSVTRRATTAIVDPFAEIAATEREAAPVEAQGKTTRTTSRTSKTRKAAIVTAHPGTERETAPTAKAKTKRKRVVKPKPNEPTLDVTAELAATEPAVELSPVFKALAEVKLPELQRENRARLQIQSPTRLYFYWSLKENPWQQLRRVFGDDLGSYTLVVKLVDLKNDIEHIHPCEAEGNWWFAAEPGSEYQAEIGFYATNRPYFRVLHSNTVTTPRRSPSPSPAGEARWTVSATKFAEVLDASGFSRDAFDVAMAGDDVHRSDLDARRAFSRFVDAGQYDFADIAGHYIRYAMAALAGGATLEELRWRVSERLFGILQSNTDKLNAGHARSAIDEYFDTEEFTTEESPSAVFGASLVHFPRTLKSRRRERYNPISSHALTK